MDTEFKSYVDNVLIPNLYQSIDVAFPDMQFVRRGNRWCSPLKMDGSQPKRPTKEKTVIKASHPYALHEGGEDSVCIITWAQKKFGCSTYTEATKVLCQKIGLPAPPCNSQEEEAYRRSKEAIINSINEMQNALYTHEAKPVLEYLTTVRGYTIDEIKEMGLGFINSQIANKYRDIFYIPGGVEFYNQLVIPYVSAGKFEGFKFRATTDKARAKYLNSSFRKSTVLFGLSAIQRESSSFKDSLMILVDGELKALYMTVKGFENVVSGAGSDKVIISSEQIKQAKSKGVRHVVIIADNEDSAEERINEERKLNATLQELNKEGLTGYVVYLPQEDENKKEDVEDFLRKYGVENLRNYVDSPQNGAEFRARLVCKKYSGEGYFDNDIQLTNFYNDVFVLMSEYRGAEIAFITSAIKDWLKGSDIEWLDAVENLAEHAEKARQRELKRIAVHNLSSDIQQAINEGDYDRALKRAVDAQKIINEDKASEFAPMFAPRKWSDITARLKERKIGIETLYKFNRGKEVDLLTLPCGALSIIAAPTNHGKSTMLQNLALQAARDKSLPGAILYLTFEEDPDSVSVQFLSKIIGKQISRDNKRSIKSYYHGNPQFINDYTAFEQGEKEMQKLIESGKLWINGTEATNGISIDALTQLTRLITQATKQIKIGVSAVFIDYIQLVQPDERTKNRTEELKEICTTLKNLAVKLNLPIILAAQFSREGSKSPYELEAESLGEGGDIERAAALIVGLWNTSKKPRQNSKYPETDKIWKDPNRLKITFDPNNPQIYIRLLKSRGEATGGEALLDCDLSTGVIYPNITVEEIKRQNAMRANTPQSVGKEQRVCILPIK